MPFTDKSAARWWCCTYRLRNIKFTPKFMDALATTYLLTLLQVISSAIPDFIGLRDAQLTWFLYLGMVKLVPEDEATLEPGEDILELEYILYTLNSLDILIYKSEFPNFFWSKEITFLVCTLHFERRFTLQTDAAVCSIALPARAFMLFLFPYTLLVSLINRQVSLSFAVMLLIFHLIMHIPSSYIHKCYTTIIAGNTKPHQRRRIRPFPFWPHDGYISVMLRRTTVVMRTTTTLRLST